MKSGMVTGLARDSLTLSKANSDQNLALGQYPAGGVNVWSRSAHSLSNLCRELRVPLTQFLNSESPSIMVTEQSTKAVNCPYVISCVLVRCDPQAITASMPPQPTKQNKPMKSPKIRPSRFSTLFPQSSNSSRARSCAYSFCRSLQHSTMSSTYLAWPFQFSSLSAATARQKLMQSAEKRIMAGRIQTMARASRQEIQKSTTQRIMNQNAIFAWRKRCCPVIGSVIPAAIMAAPAKPAFYSWFRACQSSESISFRHQARTALPVSLLIIVRRQVLPVESTPIRTTTATIDQSRLASSVACMSSIRSPHSLGMQTMRRLLATRRSRVRRKRTRLRSEKRSMRRKVRQNWKWELARSMWDSSGSRGWFRLSCDCINRMFQSLGCAILIGCCLNQKWADRIPSCLRLPRPTVKLGPFPFPDSACFPIALTCAQLQFSTDRFGPCASLGPVPTEQADGFRCLLVRLDNSTQQLLGATMAGVEESGTNGSSPLIARLEQRLQLGALRSWPPLPGLQTAPGTLLPFVQKSRFSTPN